MAQVQFYGTGRRKTSVARVRLVPGAGKILINNRMLDEYFGKKTLEMLVQQPLQLTNVLASLMSWLEFTVGHHDRRSNPTGDSLARQSG